MTDPRNGRQALKNRGFIALKLAPSALIAAALLGTDIEAVTPAGVIIDQLLLVASAAFVLFGLTALLFPSRSIVAMAGAGLILSLPVAMLGWISFLKSGLHLKSFAWASLATLGSFGHYHSLPLFRQLVGSRSGAKAIAAVLAPAVLLSGLEFWHKTFYVPAQLEATITVDPSLRFVYSQDPVINQGTAEFSLRNAGDTGTILVISVLIVCFRQNLTQLKGASVSDPDCSSRPQPISKRATVDPEGMLTHRRVFTWDEDSILVESLGRVAYARADRLRLGREINGPVECTSSLGVTTADRIWEAFPILPPSRYQSLLNVKYILAYGPGSEGGDTYWITTEDDPSCDRDDALLDEFGIREVAIASQDWITQTGDMGPDA